MLRTSDDVQINGQRLLARADLNVPMQDGKGTDVRWIRTIARTAVSNGPLGAAEITGFERATQAIIRHLARRARDGGPTSVAEINEIFREKARSARHKGGLGARDDFLVSVGIIKDPRAFIVNLESTRVVDGDLVKILSWYVNGWAYAAQMVRPENRMAAR